MKNLKTYVLVHLNFKNKTLETFVYEKDRKLTTKQAWNKIHNEKPTNIYQMAQLSQNPTIDTYWKYLNIIGVSDQEAKKYYSRYMTFDI